MQLKVEELEAGDVFSRVHSTDRTGPEGNNRYLIEMCYNNTPTRGHKGTDFRTVLKAERKRRYMYLTMATGAVVQALIGLEVSVDERPRNGAQGAAPAVPGATAPQPFNYAARQFGELESGCEFYRAKFTSDHGETKWMNIHPDDLAAIREILVDREYRSE